jgi:hypothetical protein
MHYVWPHPALQFACVCGSISMHVTVLFFYTFASDSSLEPQSISGGMGGCGGSLSYQQCHAEVHGVERLRGMERELDPPHRTGPGGRGVR